MKRSPWWFAAYDAALVQLPGSWEHRVQRAAHWARDVLRRWPAQRWRGTTRSGEPVTVLTLGDSPHVDYLPKRWLGEAAEAESLGRLWPWQAARVANEATVAIWRISSWTAQWRGGRGQWHLPDWVGTELPVTMDPREQARRNGSLHEDLRLVRNRGWRCEMSTGCGELTVFYENFYEPLVRARHGELTVYVPADWLARRMRAGGILWLAQGDQRRAGVVFAQQGNRLVLLATGVRYGEEMWLRQGALAAVYFYAWELARTRGCEVVDFGGCRPSLRDGLLRYKCKWGMRVVPKASSYDVQWMRWRSGGPTVRDFVRRFAPICWMDGRLVALRVDDACGEDACEGLPAGLEWMPVTDTGNFGTPMSPPPRGGQNDPPWLRSR